MKSLVLALAAGVALAGCTHTAHAPASTASAQSAEDAAKIAIVQEMAVAWNQLDWDKVVNMFAEDGVLHSVMVDPIVGREALAQRIGFMGAGIEEITLDFKHIGVIDGVVFVERTDRFTYNGHKGEVPVVGVIEINDEGLITEWREYYDRAELLEAMGVKTDFDAEAR